MEPLQPPGADRRGYEGARRRTDHPVGVVDPDPEGGQRVEVGHLPGHEEQSASPQAQSSFRTGTVTGFERTG